MARRSVLWISIPLLLLLVWTVIYPNIAVVAGSFGHGLEYWRAFASSPSDREALWTSLWISVASVVASVPIGLPLAFLLTRMEFRGRRVLQAAATMPAALPPLVGVIAFLFLYGESGVITRVVQILLRRDTPPWTLSGAWAIVFVHAYTMYVYVYLFVSAGLERYDSALDEAASGLGAGTFRRLYRVTLPMLTPALAGACLLVFMSSLGSFSAPYVFGGGLRVLATQIVTSRLNGAIGRRVRGDDRPGGECGGGARPAAVVRGPPALCGDRQGAGAARAAALTAGSGGDARPRRSSRWSCWCSRISMIVLVSFARDGAWTTQVLPPEYTWDNFRRLVTDTSLLPPIRNSVIMTVLATAANVVVCSVAAYLLVFRRFYGRRLLGVLVALPWAIPPTAIAIGLASTFNRTDISAARVLLVGTFWILPLAYFIRGVPLVASAIEGSLRQLDPSLEEAALGLGAGWWQTLRHVIYPAARPGLVAGATLAAITAVGEFVASEVLYTHANRPISVEILAQVRAFAFGTAAAYSVVLIGIVLLITLLARAAEDGRRGVMALRS